MKRITLSILVFLLSVYSFAETRVALVVPSAEGGLNSHANPYVVTENQATEATNVRVNEQYGSVASREVMVTEFDAGSSPIRGLYRYYKSNGDVFTIVGTSTNLIYDSSGTSVNLFKGLSDGKRWQFVTYKDMLIASNASDRILKWDGTTQTTPNTVSSRTVDYLAAELGAPFAQLCDTDDGNDLDECSYYQYRVAFYDGTNYTYSTARSNPISTGTVASSTSNIRLTSIPIGPAGTTIRYIYRTVGNSSATNVLSDSTYYLVGDVPDNSSTVSDDTVSDALLSTDRSPTWNTVSSGTQVSPPIARSLEICSERLFFGYIKLIADSSPYSTSVNYFSSIYWSDDGNPDYVYPTDFTEVRPDDGDSITFLKTFLGILTIGKTNSISKFYTEGSSTSDWSLSNPFSFIGCPAPYTATVTPLGIFYLGRNGLYRFTGQSTEVVSDVVTATIKDIAQSNIEDCVGYFWNNEYQLSYASFSGASAINNRVLIYDTIRNAYVVDIKDVDSFASFSSGSDNGTLYTGSSENDGIVAANSPTLSTLIKKYKSELDAGTVSQTSVTGTESAPILSMLTIDTMDDYTTNTLAQDAWSKTQTTASYYVPPSLGDGTDGSTTISSDTSLDNGKYDYTTLTIDAGVTVTIPSNTTIACIGDITINGTINVDSGTLDMYASSITVGATGKITTYTGTKNGSIHLRANTITVTAGGVIEEDITGTAPGWSSSSSGGNSGIDANVWDENDDTSYASVNVGGHGSRSISSTATFTSIIVSKIIYLISGQVSDGATASGTVTTSATSISSFSGSSSASGVDTTSRTTTSITASCTTDDSPALAKGSVYNKSLQIFGEPQMDYITGSGIVRASTSTSDFRPIIEVYSESSQVNEGTYSLKVVVPKGANTLNQEIIHEFASTDFTGLTTVLVDVYSLVNGTTFQIGLYDSTSHAFAYSDCTVTSAQTWETMTLDFSGMADVTTITGTTVKFTNTDAENILYVDNIRPAVASATWTSPVYTLNANTFSKLYWNEDLNTYGDVVWHMRTGNTSSPDGTWSAYTDNTVTGYTSPTGSDISSETGATYAQLRATLTTTDTTNYLYPSLYSSDGYVFKVVYSSIGSAYETSVANVWETGWRNFQQSGVMKRISRIRVFYEGEGGNLTINVTGDSYQVDQTFVIDMSVLPDTDLTDRYTGTPNNKVYTYEVPINTETEPSLIAENFRFKITANGTDVWKINRIQCVYDTEAYY